MTALIEMLLERAKLDHQIQMMRITTVLNTLRAMREKRESVNYKVLALEKQLARELAMKPHREVFIDDVLEQMEILLDIAE